MGIVAFDNTMLSVWLNPKGKVPDGKDGKPVEFAKERALGLIQQLQKSRSVIVLPTPAVSELLTAIGPDAQQYITVVSRSRLFQVTAFDARCAAELALLNRSVFDIADKKSKAQPYQKMKFDRQIIAICKVTGVTELYTDDKGISERARLCGITPIGIADVELPASSRQLPLDLEPHDELPSAEDLDAKPAST